MDEGTGVSKSGPEGWAGVRLCNLAAQGSVVAEGSVQAGGGEGTNGAGIGTVGNYQAASQGGLGNDINQTIAAYLKAAEQGVVAAQFIVGLAHLEGYRLEKNERSAYYWLRMAEENSDAIRAAKPRSSRKTTKHRKTDDIDAVEQMVAIWVPENNLLRSESPAEFISTNAESGPYRCSGILPRIVRPKQRRKQFS